MRTSGVSRTEKSLGGCLGCRKRKRKCDEAHPECNECLRRGLKCPGYRTGGVRFVPYEPQNRSFNWSGTSSILDSSRTITEGIFVSEVGNSPATETFSPIDIESTDSGGFRKNKDNDGEPAFQKSPPVGFDPQNDMPNTQPSSIHEENLHPSLLMDTINDDVYDWDSNLAAIEYIQESDITEVQNFGGQEELSSEDLGTSTENLESQALIDYNQLRGQGSFRGTEPVFIIPRPRSCLNLSSHLSVSARSASVVHLMGHYRDIAETFFSPRRTSKLPWVVMHLPTATSTLSKISSGERPKFVQTALLNAVLSVSAFNLDKMNDIKDVPSDIWWVLGQSFRSHGKLDIQKHLSLELSISDSSQYIETLMALLTMATASIIGGQLSEVRSFLLDAETCICRYVTKASRSNRSQTSMLHQIFLFQRIIEESTFMYPEWTTCVPPTGPTAVEYRSLRYPSLQTVYFRRGMEPPRSFPGALEEVLQDVSTGDDATPSMFEDIYGIPETLLSLLSKVTSLSNEIMAHKGRGNEPLLDPDLLVRSKQLEMDILQWRTAELRMDDTSYIDSLIDLDTIFDSASSDNENTARTPTNTPPQIHVSTLGFQASKSLNLAIYHGILLYFYRRISNLDPCLLQFHVDAIMKLLRNCRYEMAKAGIINCGIVWPGFLAASEALGRKRQAAIRSFMHQSTRISGMRGFDIAMDVAEEVWRLRTEKGNAAASWVHVLADQGRTVVLT